MANEAKTSGTGREDGTSNRVAAPQGGDGRGTERQRREWSDEDQARAKPKGDGQTSLTGSLQNSARTLTREIKREGRKLVADATDSATSVASEKKGVAAGYLRAVGEAVSGSCGTLEQRGYQGTSGFVRHVAEELGMLADNIEHKNPRDLLAEVENYARANPAIFLGATLLAGFGIVRLLKSGDSEDSYDAAGNDAGDETDFDDDDVGDYDDELSYEPQQM
jgi:hypothetical protein